MRSIPAIPTGLLSDNITFVDVLGREMSLSYADFLASALLREFERKSALGEHTLARNMLTEDLIPVWIRPQTPTNPST